MSTYTTAETALLTLVRAYNSGATFTTANSAVDDWRVLDAENNEAAVLTQVGEMLEADEIDGRGSHGKRQERYTIGVHLFVKVRDAEGGPGAADAALKTLVEGLKPHIRQYERLNGAAGVKRAQITNTSVPRDAQRKRPGAPRLVMQSITVQVDAEFTPTVVEYSN